MDLKRKVIVDDDIVGVRTGAMFAVMAPETEVLGITVVTGGAWRDECVAHTLRMLEIVGRTDIPVLPGAVHPLVNTEEATRRWESLHGKLVYKGAWMDEAWPDGTLQSQPRYHGPDVVPPLPQGDPTTRASTEAAASFLVRKVREFPGEVTIVATGPMTNIALAQRLDPGFASNAKELVYMGGSLNPRQRRSSLSATQFGHEFANTPRLEFNFRFDPEAASIMLRARWRRITMVPVDPSTATELTPELLQAMTQVDTPLTRALRAHTEPGFPLWDEIAVAVWLHPELITGSEPLAIGVDTAFSAGYGNTLSWPAGRGPGLGEQMSTVVRDIDVAGFDRWMVDVAQRPIGR